MSTDRPAPGGPADDQYSPAAEPTEPLPPGDPTRVIPTSEPASLPNVDPTRWIPPTEPTVTVDPWPAGQDTWPPPAQPFGQPDQPPAELVGPPYPPPAQPFPAGTLQGGWQHRPQPGPYAGAQRFVGTGTQGVVGQPGPQGWDPPQGGPPGHWATAPPQPLTGHLPQLTPQRRGHGWVVALVTVAAVVAVSLIAAIAVPALTQLPGRRGGGPTAAPSAPQATAVAKPTGSTTPTAKPTPSPTPTPTMPSDPLVVLKKNPIYALKVPATCAYQGMPNSQASYRKQVGKLLACQNAAWKKALAPTAVEFGKPKVRFYSTSIKSPCGRLGTTFPASYCTGNSTLYFSSAAYAQGSYFRLSVASFVFHEYAHHVQNLAGLFEAMGAMKESAAVTKRRIELQAHCVSHYAFTVSRVGIGSSDIRAIEYQWDHTSDAKGHGSTRAERYWGQRGLDAKTIGACNTWSVKAAKVK